MMEEDDCCIGGGTSVENQQQQQHYTHYSPHSSESSVSVSSKLVQLLLCLPALRQADQLIRQYWTKVHRENQQQLAATEVAQQQQNTTVISANGEGCFTRHSAAADPPSSVGNGSGSTAVVQMNKLFVEMLEACLR